ncbi:hypothetical protein EZV62_025698 [Acer yangbiense]|uniref:Uncharacterized protein n=1 Tax=Acer yangbiense TaxID=1000413 RepID=A0A5C7GYJ3_9ROSI|nr:hypothetical protein EZV62_025698 [Acer yangbiense]
MKMSQARVKEDSSSHDPLKSSKFFIFQYRPCEILVIFARILLLFCLIASISLVLYSSFTAQSREIRLDLPRPPESVPVTDNNPTNISHILFGISGSSATWHDRVRYSNLWWETDRTRGFMWLDEEPRETNNSSRKLKPSQSQAHNTMPYRVSDPGWTRFKFSSSKSAVRIARILWDSFKAVKSRNDVRWFVMGDDDTVFFTHNLVSVLARYDHNQMWYIGGNSESVEQDVMHAYDMAFGGGGFAVSYPLAERLVKAMDGCLERYYYFYGSDQRIWACASELGVPLTPERGFHQMDIRGDPYGLLAAHPMAPLVSLHHVEYLDSLFPSWNRIDSLKILMSAYRVDPNRILQQSICYDTKRKWSLSISWGYTVQIYPLLLSANNLAMPLQTFKTWRSWSDGPFVFNTRHVSNDPCQHPVVYFLDQAEKVGRTGTQTIYSQFGPKFGKGCDRPEYRKAMAIKKIVVSSLKMDPEYWLKATQRQCCEIMDGGSIKDGTMKIRVRKCRATDIMAV